MIGTIACRLYVISFIELLRSCIGVVIEQKHQEPHILWLEAKDLYENG